jgi:hypothetical protein
MCLEVILLDVSVHALAWSVEQTLVIGLVSWNLSYPARAICLASCAKCAEIAQ